MTWMQKLRFMLWYWKEPPWDTGVTPPELEAFIQNTPPGRALDLGCGTGTNAIRLADAGWEVTGVDFVGKAVRKARSKARKSGQKVDFRVGDVTKLRDINGKFDLVLDIGCFHGIGREKYEKYASNIDRFLSPKGTFLLYVFFRNSDQDAAGIIEPELNVFSPMLEIYHRENGTNRFERASSWLWMHRPGS